MAVSKVKGQINETTGKLTGDKGLQAKGKIEKGAAEVKEIVGGAVHYVTDLIGDVLNLVTDTAHDVYGGFRRLIRKVF